MKRTVTKEIKFEAAHRLTGNYPGKCKHLHGHSWIVYVEIEGEELDQYGMVFDFANFKYLRDWIDENLDHATILSNRDHELFNMLRELDQKKFVVEDNPTSEVLCELVYHKAYEMLCRFENPVKLSVRSVRIKETCTSEAYYGV